MAKEEKTEVKTGEKIEKNNKKEEVKKEEKTEVKEKVEEKKIDRKDERKKKEERLAILNINTTFNNTIMTMTDMSGNTISRYSGGESTKQSRLKANPTIAMFVAQKIAEEAKDNGITGFYVKIRAKTGENNPGPGAHTAVKSLTRAGFRIVSILDVTRIPRGGPKKPHGRRGRRV
ncbi:30S ribosomal protein S11 [Candidatus Pacearchaeota archaeon]|nr:30S ribosomal protein S11 [Candidatus Pacearchaeota archaeon]